MPESDGAMREGERRQPGHGRRASTRGARKPNRAALLLGCLVTLLGASARAQSGPTSPPPAATPVEAPAVVPIEPLTAGPANGPPPVLTPGPFAAPAPTDAPPVVVAAAPSHEPFYQKWWFWTAVGAAAVTTFAILIATSGTSPPHTDFGNMPAF